MNDGVDAAVIHPPEWDPGSTELAFKAVRDYPSRFAGWRQQPGRTYGRKRSYRTEARPLARGAPSPYGSTPRSELLGERPSLQAAADPSPGIAVARRVYRGVGANAIGRQGRLQR